MSKNKATVYSVKKNGHIFLSEFAPRTFRAVVKPLLPKGWRSNPKLLSKACENEIVLGLIVALRNSYATMCCEQLEKAESELRAAFDKQSKKADQQVQDQQPLELSPELISLGVGSLTLEKDLKLVENNTPAQWVAKLDALTYEWLVESLLTILDSPLTEKSVAWNPRLDTADGAAAMQLIQMPPKVLHKLGITFEWEEDGELPVSALTKTKVPELLELSKKFKDSFTFVAEPAKKSARTAKKAAPKAKPETAKQEPAADAKTEA